MKEALALPLTPTISVLQTLKVAVMDQAMLILHLRLPLPKEVLQVRPAPLTAKRIVSPTVMTTKRKELGRTRRIPILLAVRSALFRL